jgi:hypothetical protein
MSMALDSGSRPSRQLQFYCGARPAQRVYGP